MSYCHRNLGGGGVNEVDEQLDEGGEQDAADEEPVNEAAVTGSQQAMLGNAEAAAVDKEQAPTPNAGAPEKDIADMPISNAPRTGPLTSERDEALQSVYKVIRHDTVLLRDLEFASPWLVRESYEEEEKNWVGVFEVVDESQVPKGANVISSHVAYKIKVGEDNTLKLKARICPHGNRDKEKDGIRKDSAAVQFPIIRLMLSIAALLGLRLGTIDITAAYLQSGPIKRIIYVRPPKEHRGQRGKLWKLLKLPYGIAEAGRQWQTTCETWLLSPEVGFEKVQGISQLFVIRRPNRSIRMLCAKVTDDFLLAGSRQDLRWFDGMMRKRFTVSKSILDGRINFNGAVIEQDEQGSILLSMEAYMERVEPIPIERSRRKEQEDSLTQSELTQYRGLAGMLNWAGRAAVPVACFVASDMQQKLASVRVKHLCSANGMLAELKKLTPKIWFSSPAKKVTESFVASFSDASFNTSSSRSYGQSGFISGIAFRQQDSDSLEYHVCDWNSGKQRRVCYSSYGAEILAAADADDRTYAMRESIRSLFAGSSMKPIPSTLYVDSNGLFDTITTLHESRDYRMRQTVQRIRDSFEAKDLDALVWIPGVENVSDALTKRNAEMQRKLNVVCTTGSFPKLDLEKRLDAQHWE